MITVLEPGRFTSFQDGGRCGLAHLGVPQAGAVDSLSLRQTNLLVGNPEYATALEMTLGGPVLRFEASAVIALAGGRVEARLDDAPIPMYQSVAVRSGQVLNCGDVLTGMRCYLAVAGGFPVSPVLGSTSTDIFSGMGPRVLRTGDIVNIQSQNLEQGWYLRAPPKFPVQVSLRVVLGPHMHWFTDNALSTFLQSEYEVRSDSDRTGVRLTGARVAHSNQDELSSQGMVSGAVQVPSDGHPILLLPNHGTTGGYPVIAVVIRADQPRLGQLRSGTKLSFKPVSREQALVELRDAEVNLREAIVPADPGLLVARSLMMLAESHPVLREASLHLDSRRVYLRR